MNKYIIRIVILLCFFFVIPLITFYFQDKINMNKSDLYESKLNDETLISKYPLVSNVYDNFFDDEEEIPEKFSISDLTSLSQEKQKEAKGIKKVFETEIQKLIDNNILPKEYIEYENNLEIDFGQVSLYRKQEIAYLNQTYRLNTERDRIIDYIMDLDTKKIISVRIYATDLNLMSLEKQEDTLKKVLGYLELDDIDDWSFSSYGMESYKARLQLFYNYSSFSEGTQYIYISLAPYGEMRGSHIYIHDYGN